MMANSFVLAPEYILISNMLSHLWNRLFVLYQMAANCRNTLMYLWLLSHAGCLGGFFASFVYPAAYDVAVAGCVLTYALAVQRHLSVIMREVHASLRSRAPILELLRGENTLLLATAILMANTAPSLVKLLPFATYATMNLVSFLLLDILANSAFSNSSMPILRHLETSILSYVCYWDFAVMAAYVIEGFQTRRFCWLAFYMISWLVKLEISEFSRSSFHGLVKLAVHAAEALKIGPVITAAYYVLAAVWILLPTKEDLPEFVPSLAISSKEHAGSIMLDTFSIINDVDR